jgi:hypothetical protein
MEKVGPTKSELEAQIVDLKNRFESGMRARGFDPEQAENVPLPPALAKLQVECDELIEQLANLKESRYDGN